MTGKEVPLLCPHCGATDIPGARPTLEVGQHGLINCTCCGFSWVPRQSAWQKATES